MQLLKALTHMQMKGGNFVNQASQRTRRFLYNTNRVPECQKLELPTEDAVHPRDIVRHDRIHVIVINRESKLQESNGVESDR